ncbi:ArsC/Spx/MgsR family protein [Amaricoccus tamworthensis]|uniref:ArsC/Spx/MgsR family protein n=1 Tax=Amaricoccus tamworthensis TaxID=57002 RepID=UPI003C7A6013
MAIRMYGMSGCTTVKRGADWLEEQGVEFERINFNKAENLASDLDAWIDAAGLTTVMNLKAANFKKLDEATQERLKSDRAAAIEAMVENPRIIKRPLLDANGTVIPGFDRDAWAKAIG